MTLDQEFDQYKGQSLLVPGADSEYRGQCFQWFDYVLHDVYDLPYFWGASAIGIYLTPGVLLQSFDKIPYSPDMPINKGDFVIYGAGVGTEDGHVSVAAEDGTGSNYIGYDSNWGDSGKLEQITHNDRFNQTIIGVLRIKGGDMPTLPTKQQVIDAYGKHNLKTDGTATPATQADIDYYSSQDVSVLYAVLLDHETALAQKLVAQSQSGAAGGDAKKLQQIKTILGE